VVLNLVYLGWSLVGVGHQPESTGDSFEPAAYPETLQLVEGGNPLSSGLAPEVSAQLGCPAVGPLADESVAREIVSALEKAGYGAEARQVELRNTPVYWVLVPPLASRQLAEQKLREFHVKGIDSFLVATGEDANAISLGVFANRSSALGVQSRMAAAGVKADIREQRRDVRQRWVVLADPAAQGFLQFIPESHRGALGLDRFACR
jgi:hypothetical protein